VQRAISLARDAIDDDGRSIRTVPKQGYRFVAPVEEEERSRPAVEPFQPRFALSADAHIAYYVLGEGPVDLVVVSGWVFPMRGYFEHPEFDAWLRRLLPLGRIILFDKRGTGLSDRVKVLPTLQQRVDDLSAVLQAAGSSRAILLGRSEGGPLALVYAAAFPERVQGLLLLGAFARWLAAPDYPHGWAPEVLDELRRYIATRWGGGYTIRSILGEQAQDPGFAAWAARTEVEGASPGAARDLLEMNMRVDVRALLPAVSVPTVVLHSKEDSVIPIGNARYLAAHIPGARLVEIDGDDHAFLRHTDAICDAVEWVKAQAPQRNAHFLTTALVLEVDGGVADAAALDQAVAPFRDLCSSKGSRARIGVHAGEVARVHGRLAGEAVDTARAIARAAGPDEVRVSRVVRDLVHGSTLGFAPRDKVVLVDGRSVPTVASVVLKDQEKIRTAKGQ
jgi:pimeloyl-ACP methyl ester carboxylesterase